MKKGITSFVHSDAILVSLNIYGDWPADERLKKKMAAAEKKSFHLYNGRHRE